MAESQDESYQVDYVSGKAWETEDIREELDDIETIDWDSGEQKCEYF